MMKTEETSLSNRDYEVSSSQRLWFPLDFLRPPSDKIFIFVCFTLIIKLHKKPLLLLTKRVAAQRPLCDVVLLA